MEVRHDRRVHSIARIEICSGIPFADFISALEAAAPPVDRSAVERVMAAGGDWDDVRAAAAQNAPNDLMTYAKIDARDYFAIAGHDTPAVEYLIGNHVIAETMFRHDPRAMLFAPLRMLVYGDVDGNAVFTMDQPSATFGSLGHPDIAQVGADLDQKVLALLRIVGVDVGASFD